MVSYGGKTIPRWRTAAILKIDISQHLSGKLSDFHEILYTAADFELDERHVIKNEKVALDRLRVRQNVFLVFGINLPKRGIPPYAIFIKFELAEGVAVSHLHAKFHRSGLKIWAYSLKNREKSQFLV